MDHQRSIRRHMSTQTLKAKDFAGLITVRCRKFPRHFIWRKGRAFREGISLGFVHDSRKIFATTVGCYINVKV